MLYSIEGEIEKEPLKIGKAKVLCSGSDITIISYSRAVHTALEVASLLKKRGS